MNTETQNAYRHMRAHAGYVVGESAKGALKLAKAYASLQECIADGWVRVVWDIDCDADLSWMDEKTRADYFDGNFEMLACRVEVYRNGAWECVASQCGISVKDTRDPYARVVEAELAIEGGF